MTKKARPTSSNAHAFKTRAEKAQARADRNPTNAKVYAKAQVKWRLYEEAKRLAEGARKHPFLTQRWVGPGYAGSEEEKPNPANEVEVKPVVRILSKDGDDGKPASIEIKIEDESDTGERDERFEGERPTFAFGPEKQKSEGKTTDGADVELEAWKEATRELLDECETWAKTLGWR